MKTDPPKFFARKPIYDDDWIYDAEKCKICKKEISEHSSNEAFDCAIAIVVGAGGTR